MFSPPADSDLPPVKSFQVYIDCSGVDASAHNMFILSRLHKRFRNLKPVELKPLITSGRQHCIGQIPRWELDELQKAAAHTAFTVVAHEDSTAPHAAT